MLPTLVSGGMGGTEVYAENLVLHLRENADERLDITVVRGRQPNHFQPVNTSKTIYRDNFRDITIDAVTSGLTHGSKAWAWLSSTLRRHSIWSDIESAAGGRIDIAVYPLSAVQPAPRGRTKTVSIIHDVQHRDMPGAFTVAQRIYRKFTYERPASRAAAVVTVSDFSRESVISHLRVDPTRVRRVYPGIDTTIFHAAASPELLTEPARTMAAGKPVAQALLFFPARALPHKNHARLLAAVAKLRERWPDLRLILSGSDGEALGTLPDYVTHVGNISAVQVRDLYRVSTVVFPSLYEGFGFPPLEALATGATVVSSRVGALAEWKTEAVVFVNPSSVESISEGIEATLQRTVTKISDPTTVVASTFNWKTTADEITELLVNL